MRRVLVIVACATLSAVALGGFAPPANAAELGAIATRRTVENLVHQTYPDLTFGNVACPSHVNEQQGTKFTCTVQLPGAFLVVDAVETDAKGTASFTTPQAVISQDALRQFVAANASLAATVDCGAGPWLVARPATKITCGATLADGTVRHAELTVTDTAGNVTITAVT